MSKTDNIITELKIIVKRWRDFKRVGREKFNINNSISTIEAICQIDEIIEKFENI